MHNSIEPPYHCLKSRPHPEDSQLPELLVMALPIFKNVFMSPG